MKWIFAAALALAPTTVAVAQPAVDSPPAVAQKTNCGCDVGNEVCLMLCGDKVGGGGGGGGLFSRSGNRGYGTEMRRPNPN